MIKEKFNNLQIPTSLTHVVSGCAFAGVFRGCVRLTGYAAQLIESLDCNDDQEMINVEEFESVLRRHIEV